MTRFWTSDHHIGHENIVHNLGRGRPFRNLSHMHKTIRDNWFARIRDEDEVWLLGDLAMGSFEETIEFYRHLPGCKFMVPGNHDKIFSFNNTQKRINRFTPLYESVGFTILPENTSTEVETNYGIQKVAVSHFPYQKDHIGTVRNVSSRPEDLGLPLIHGHTHSWEATDWKSLEFNVGVDAHAFVPVPEQEIVSWLEELQRLGKL